MGKQSDQLSDRLTDFICKQKIYFVATAAADGKVNLSPKGLDSLRVLGPNRIVWRNLTGSGNETAAHVALHPRMTIMFMAMEGAPLILRLYGRAKVVHPRDEAWNQLAPLFDEHVSARQIFDLEIEMVQTSCGTGVPLFEYVEQRGQLDQWAAVKGKDGVEAYWKERNQVSLDGFPTHVLES